MAIKALPPLPGVDPETAPLPGDPSYDDWVESAAFSPEGIDRELIWEMLHKTPSERLRSLQDFVDSFHDAAARATPVR